MSKDDKKFPFFIKTDKEDIKLKLKENMQDLADKFSWQRFLTKTITNKKFLISMLFIIIVGGLYLGNVYDSGSDSTYQEKITINETIPAQNNAEKELEVERNSTSLEGSKVQTGSEVTQNKAVQKVTEEATEKSQEAVQQASPRPQFNLPIKGTEVKRQYGWSKHPVLEDWRYHEGVDFAASPTTPIRAVAAGKVEEIKEDDYLGFVLILEHNNGFQSVYGHASKYYLEEGQQVKAGQAIGEVGDSGLVLEPTLHFELWKGKERLNPNEYLDL
ncbi:MULTISPECIES: M23 family metallopeptidase [unclassified Candidatus Frackibacter]|uniref:M23 family metallopeptidase n=1 Tax=unclassified Candidatus Frackibacter TaxID=2648818 RepID=UPI00087FF68A|nr:MULTISPECIES: M23 family metallopeptidase [unclassified Candidatus Frackibacter]SDC10158.1 Peptidase family M23 [Candidatus Frackibacter sp. WG11]SEM37336.1 Peptidase family M23 [Candidatus Frackibacter sp. WG12]SFL42785.1 Peptidase family M23 [Candidatus Frackibacter sp. WG13]